jgi:hypothetical protein
LISGKERQRKNQKLKIRTEYFRIENEKAPYLRGFF